MKGKIKDFFELNPAQNTNKYKDFINYIDTASVENGVLNNIEILNCNFPSRAQRIVKNDDILYSSVRPNLRHYYHYRNNYDHPVASTGFVLIRNKNAENYSTRFLFYYLSSNSVVKHLSNIAELSQSTFPSFSPKDLGKLDLPELTIDKQTKIASILSAYDDLIENNNKRIKILEQMAENLYKEWFVCFRFPGYETAEFENGIPKDWKYVKLGKILSFVRGISYSSEEIDCDDGLNLLNLKNIQSYGGFRRDGTKKYNGKYKAQQVVKKGDLIMGVTDMTQDRRTVGSVALVPHIGGTSIISADLVKVNSDVDKRFLYCMCRYGFYSAYFSQFANGANVLHLRSDTLLNKKLLLPDEKIIGKFIEILSPIIQMIDELNIAKDYAKTQRDLLLPRLISGKLEV